MMTRMGRRNPRKKYMLGKKGLWAFSGMQEPVSDRKSSGGHDRKPGGNPMQRHRSQEAPRNTTKRRNVIIPLYLEEGKGRNKG